MTSNIKWTDLGIASTLWSLVGSQPSASNPAQPESKNAASSQLEHHQHHQADAAPSQNQPETDSKAPDAAADGMADLEDRPIEGLAAFDSYEHDAQVSNEDDGVPDEDFGPIEMFDSNATQAPFSSSQLNATAFEENKNRAPEAVMFAESTATESATAANAAEPSSTRKSKRDKKDKKKRKSLQEGGSDDLVEQEEALSKHRRSKRKSEAHAEEAHATASADVTEEDAVPSTQSKRKRRSSGTGESKHRKKHKSHDHGDADTEAVAEEAQEQDNAAVTTSVVHETPIESDPKSQEAQPEGIVVPPSAQPDAMDVDHSIPSAQFNPEPAVDPYQVPAEVEGETDTLAGNTSIEPVNEHSHPEENFAPEPNSDVHMEDNSYPDPTGQGVYDVPQSPNNAPSSTSKRTRSARAKKAAKPTFFEKSPTPEADANREALDELPSPSAATPAPRKRTKTASKPRKSRAKATSMANRDDDGYDAAGGRPNKTTGYTQGRFSEDELKRIARIVENFRAENDLEQTKVNEMIHAPGGTSAGESHAELWQRIFAACPDRHRQKLINITRKKFHNFVARGTWTTAQDAELRDYIEVHGTKWAKIAALINRHPEDLRDRYRNYIVCGDAQRKDAWDENEERNLTQYIMEAMKTIDELRSMDPSRELLRKPYEELIDWQNISERMERTRSRLQCITKWKAMNIKTHGKDHLVSYQPDAEISFRLEKARRQLAAMPEEERFRLVLSIQGTTALTDAKIPWHKLGDKQFRNNWHRFTQLLLWRRLKHSVPGWETMTVRDCAQRLVDQYNQTGELPELKDEDYSDTQEMEFLEGIPKWPKTPAAAAATTQMSAEYVANSDAEDDEQNEEAKEVNGTGEDDDVVPPTDPSGVPDENIQPDLPVMSLEQAGAAVTPQPAETPEPELPELPAPIEEPEDVEPPEPAPPRATKVAKRTYGKRRSMPRKTPVKKTLGPSQDPIEDEPEFLTQPPAVEEDNNSEIDEERFRKRKTPSKFRSAAPPAPASDGSDSVMDDMEDLPARLPLADAA